VTTFFSKESLDIQARKLLSEYGKKHSPFVEPPVDICAVTETFLGLRLDYMDLEREYGEGVLGAINFEKKTVYVNTALDPVENDSAEGRHNFTIAHEVGHWQLHRHEFLLPENLRDNGPRPSILCRTAQKKEPREWQADQFASYLLMPRPMVQQAWRKRYGSRILPVGNVDAFKRGDDLQASLRDYYLLVKDFAHLFAVSGHAMRIRLVDLGFVCADAK
jgi:Zn-dependent peptidase ImmA (M78 family)